MKRRRVRPLARAPPAANGTRVGDTVPSRRSFSVGSAPTSTARNRAAPPTRAAGGHHQARHVGRIRARPPRRPRTRRPGSAVRWERPPAMRRHRGRSTDRCRRGRPACPRRRSTRTAPRRPWSRGACPRQTAYSTSPPVASAHTFPIVLPQVIPPPAPEPAVLVPIRHRFVASHFNHHRHPQARRPRFGDSG